MRELSCQCVTKCKYLLVSLFLVITQKKLVEWGERPTFLMTEVLHRQLLIKSLSSAVSYTQSHDHEAQCGNNKPQDPYYFTLVTTSHVVEKNSTEER